MATLYMGAGETYTNLNDAFAAMNGGDDLIVKNGTYPSADNVITDANMLPSGTAGNWTTVRAETEGQVTFDGEDLSHMVLIFGATDAKYFSFTGIRWIRTLKHVASNAGIYVNASFFKFIRCGASKSNLSDGGSTWYMATASDYLLEECYAWGNGKYGFSNYHSGRGILRRCVVRLDAVDGGGLPAACYQNYASENMKYQNCIAIDCDSANYTDVSYDSGGITIRQSEGAFYSDNVHWGDSIVLNYNSPTGGDLEVAPASGIGGGRDNRVPNSYSNMVAWDCSAGIAIGSASGDGILDFDHITINTRVNASVDALGVTGSYYNDGDIYDTIITGNGGIGVKRWNGGLNNNLLDGFTTNCTQSTNCPGTGTVTDVDPIWHRDTNPDGGLRYIVRIEEDSNLSTLGSDGGKIGATILYRRGVSGTLYGESGYDTLTSDPLWPFPYEDQIKTDFASYTGPPAADRGFCASGESLTNYIWAYLGNTVPPFGVTTVEDGSDVDVTWDAPPAESLDTLTGFNLYDISGVTPELLDTVGAGETSATLTGLAEEESYQVAVTAIDGTKGEGGYVYPSPATEEASTTDSAPLSLGLGIGL